MAADTLIRIEIVYALPDAQHVFGLTVPRGTTAREAIVLGGLAARHREIAAGECALGVYGRVVSGDTVLDDGDRVEIYRPLLADPKQARRRRASKQRL